MPPLEEYIENAKKLAQEVVNAWGVNVSAGNANLLTDEFRALCDKTFPFHQIKRIADNHREHGGLSEGLAAEERAARLAFAEAYKAFYEKHAEKSSAAASRP